MGFKLPDLDNVSNTQKSSDTSSLDKPNKNTRAFEQTDSRQQKSEDNRKLDTDIPPLSPLDEDDIKDLTDDDFDNEIDKELSDEENTEKSSPPVLSSDKGIINTVEEYNGDYRIQVRKSLDDSDIFYLDKEIVGDKYDAILPNLRAGVPIEFNYDDSKSYNRGNTRVYVVNEITKLNTSQHLHTPTEEQKPNDKPILNKPKQKPKRQHHFWKILLKWNDAIGNVLYRIINFVLRWTFYRLPFVGSLLVHTKIFWKLFCRLWTIILIGLIWFIMSAGQLHAKGVYTVRNDTTNLKVTNIRFDNHKKILNLDVTNNSTTYAYYYLKTNIHEQGIIPFIGGKDITCEGPSVGQAINASQKMSLQCNAPKTSRHVAYKFTINNTQ